MYDNIRDVLIDNYIAECEASNLRRENGELLKENAQLKKMISQFVFCKDCRWWKLNAVCGRFNMATTKENDFCSRGEWKNTNEDVAW